MSDTLEKRKRVLRKEWLHLGDRLISQENRDGRLSRDAVFQRRVAWVILSDVMLRPLEAQLENQRIITDAEAISIFNECRWEFYARLVRSGVLSFRGMLKLAADEFSDRDLRLFVGAIDQPPKQTLDALDRLILTCWDGFDALRINPPDHPTGKNLRACPPLRRWSHSAAWQCMRFLLNDKGLTYTTYRQRPLRIGRTRELPVLVAKARCDSALRNLEICPSPKLLEWFKRRNCDRN